ncbi:MAG: hotdog fold thioesterase [Deltaproteobacteria bacterium]|nr:hotdog fold thioesterase [Deltaproteobacteria bacterium]
MTDATPPLKTEDSSKNDAPEVTRDQVIGFINERHPHTVLGKLGVEYTSFDPDSVTVEVDVSEGLFQHAGIVHGGIYVLLAESVASTAAALSCDMGKVEVLGLEINANHLRSVSEGRIRAVATAVHRGGMTHVYTVEVKDQRDRLICTSRCTLAIRQRR